MKYELKYSRIDLSSACIAMKKRRLQKKMTITHLEKKYVQREKIFCCKMLLSSIFIGDDYLKSARFFPVEHFQVNRYTRLSALK